MKPEFFITFTTCPDNSVATKLANAVIENQLAACVNIIPGIQSVYRWQGKIESDAEYLLMMKTNQEKLAELETLIQSQHPYDLPEFIAIDIEAGSQAYLNWITKAVSG